MTRGLVVWITGRPSAGKSTFAARLGERLLERGLAPVVLDGDAVRAALVPSPGYSREERAQFYETLARLAALVATQGRVVVVPATAHRREFRERARKLAPSFLEVFLDVSESECHERDAKGLYAQERAGALDQVPGADLEYEVPERPEIVGHGGDDGMAVDAAADVIDRLARA